MRTTVTIDPDTEHLLKQEAARTGASFKVVLNEAIRRALSAPSEKPFKVEPLFTKPFPASLRDRNMNHLADELDDEDTLKELVR